MFELDFLAGAAAIDEQDQLSVLLPQTAFDVTPSQNPLSHHRYFGYESATSFDELLSVDLEATDAKNNRAVALPMPRDEPVTSTFLPANSIYFAPEYPILEHPAPGKGSATGAIARFEDLHWQHAGLFYRSG